MSQKFEAFLFDLDGTLVDSNGIVERVMEAWCQQNGVSYSEIKSEYGHDSFLLEDPGYHELIRVFFSNML